MTKIAQLGRDLLRVRADNPSPMTAEGTNTYIIGNTDLAVIDPGPDDPKHLACLLEQIGPQRVTGIFVTHSHKDHSPLASKLSQATGAPVLAFGDSTSGRSTKMQELATLDGIGGGEGVDLAFAPNIRLQDGQALHLGPDQITALWTPGHMGNHMCFLWRNQLFTGDHVMGWAPSLVSPPDGDMGAYMQSLQRLENVAAYMFHPGHGIPITDPKARLEELQSHRRAREAAILRELELGSADIASLVGRIYRSVSANLHAAAARNVFAHLVDLHTRNEVEAQPKLCPTARFSRAVAD